MAKSRGKRPRGTTDQEPAGKIVAVCIIYYCLDCFLRSTNSLTYAGFRLTCRLPHCRFATWSSLAVSELQLSAATLLWLYHGAASLPSWIEFNCLRSAAVGKAARLSINWLDAAWRCLPLGHPSAASGACAVVQISSSKRQCGKRQVSLKAALRRNWSLKSKVSMFCAYYQSLFKKKNNTSILKQIVWETQKLPSRPDSSELLIRTCKIFFRSINSHF